LFISETGENSGKNKAAKECTILYRDFPKVAERSRYVADIRDRVNCYATTSPQYITSSVESQLTQINILFILSIQQHPTFVKYKWCYHIFREQILPICAGSGRENGESGNR